MSTLVDLIAVALFAGSLASALIIGALMMRAGVVDAPDGVRKTQSAAVPRLGGVAIAGPLIIFVLVTAPTSIGYAVFSGANFSAFIAVFGAFLIGLWDDINPVSASLKLILLAICFVAAAFLGLHPAELASPFGTVTLLAALAIGSALWLLVFTNAANFIDGANGLAIGCIAIMLLGLALISQQHGNLYFGYGWFVLFGALAGFLIHNLMGKLYAGDAGALGLGALFASLGLISGLEVWTVATLALPFLIDVLLTLVWRAKHRRAWLKPHLDHAYQRMITNGWSHLDVAILYWGLSGVCAAAAYIAASGGGVLPFIMFWVLTAIGTILWRLHRRAQT